MGNISHDGNVSGNKYPKYFHSGFNTGNRIGIIPMMGMSLGINNRNISIVDLIPVIEFVLFP